MRTTSTKTIYQDAQRFAEISEKLILTGNISRAKHCFEVAEIIFKHGTAEVKNAIANVYLYSLSTFMELHHINIKSLLPQALQKEYYKQVNTSGV